MKHTYLSKTAVDEALREHSITQSEAENLKIRLILNQQFLSLFIKKTNF